MEMIFDQAKPKSHSWLLINLGLVLLSVSFYVLSASRTQEVGFPLDDAWIHQTYARNLADLGEWSFVPGIPSAGSTAPLWSLLLSVFHKISSGIPFFQTYLLGAVCLWALACLAEMIFRKNLSGYTSPIPIAGGIVIFEWHLVWAAGSGMETLLLAVFIILVFYLLQTKNRLRYGWIGLTIGVGVWIRPETLTLLGPALLLPLLTGKTLRQKVIPILAVLAGLTLPIVAYLLFNTFLSGHAWPNTFYAKQAEYASLRSASIFIRYVRELTLPLTGIGMILLPGFLYKCYQAFKYREILWMSAILWWLGISLIYAVQLPVTYQHGRYLIPAMPVFFLTGLIGSFEGVINFKTGGRIRWVAVRVWGAALAIVLGVFYALGANSYSKDVAIINTEMVAAAKWLQANTKPDQIIAVHDIGAVGYFSQRKIIDLAGLVTPEVIPIIRDEDGLKQFLDTHQAAYLMTFPDWYTRLTKGLEEVYQSKGTFSPAAGGENIVIYRWSVP